MSLFKKWILVLLVAGLAASAQAWKRPCASCLRLTEEKASVFPGMEASRTKN